MHQKGYVNPRRTCVILDGRHWEELKKRASENPTGSLSFELFKILEEHLQRK